MNRTGWAAIVFAILGVLCRTLEAIVYGGELDANGVVQESLFLPLTFLFLGLSIVLAVIAVVLWLTRRASSGPVS